MHYLVTLKAEGLVRDEDVADRDDVYVSPAGDRGWAIFDADDEESLRRDLLQEGQEVEEIQPLLTAREYRAILEAREDLESSKARFVDTPLRCPVGGPQGGRSSSGGLELSAAGARRRGLQIPPRSPPRVPRHRHGTIGEPGGHEGRLQSALEPPGSPGPHL